MKLIKLNIKATRRTSKCPLSIFLVVVAKHLSLSDAMCIQLSILIGISEICKNVSLESEMDSSQIPRK